MEQHVKNGAACGIIKGGLRAPALLPKQGKGLPHRILVLHLPADLNIIMKGGEPFFILDSTRVLHRAPTGAWVQNK